MKATVTSPENWKKCLELEVPAEKIEAAFNVKLTKYKKTVKIPGFRPGKVPDHLVVSRFGDAIRAEAVEELMNGAYRLACAENNINPVSEPVIEGVNGAIKPGESITFTAHVEVDPEIDIVGYRDLNIAVAFEELEDKEVDEFIEALREQRAEFKDLDRPSQKGDVLSVRYEDVKIDGELRDGFVPAPPMVELGKSPLKELNSGLVGLSQGEKKLVSLVFPKDYSMPELAGKMGEFTVEILAVREKTLAELNEDFAKSFGAENVEELLVKIREDLKVRKEQKCKDVAYDAAISELLEKNDFDVPPARIDDYVRRIMREEEQYYPNGGQPTFEVYREGYMTVAQRALKRYRILEHIAKIEKIRATQEEVDAKINEIANQYGQPFETVKQAFRKNGTTIQIREDIKERKALDSLVGLLVWPEEGIA